MEVSDQIRNTANIIEIASQYTNLRKRGSKHVGLCPFHTEKTPSFTLDEDKQLYHCFGCGAGGDIFTLVMEKENLSFPEALQYLADKYRIKIPEKKTISPKLKSLKENVAEVTKSALTFFSNNLHNTTEGAKAKKYLLDRKVTEETIKTLNIGYALHSWDSLLNFFQKKAIHPELLEKAGLVLRRQNNKGFYDRFRGRVIFPIFDDRTGKVTAFGGRTLYDEDPKYLNSPDTLIYSKGNMLYGLNLTKNEIRDKGDVFLVEGYTDFLALFQAGICNVVASLGTSLTTQQINLLRRRSASRIISAYDGDTAGKKATFRAISLCLEQGMQVMVLPLPEGQDPDSFLSAKGLLGFEKLAEKSISALRFLLNYRTGGKRPESPEEKARIAKEIMEEINKIPDTIVKSEYIKKMSEYLAIDENTQRAILSSGKSKAEKTSRKVHLMNAEIRLLQIIFADSGIAGAVFKTLHQDDIKGLNSEPIFTALFDFFQSGKTPNFFEIQKKLDPGLYNILAEILLDESQAPTTTEAIDCVYTLRQIALTQQLKGLKTQVSQVSNNKDQEKILLHKIQDINKHLYELSQRIIKSQTRND